MNIDSWLVEKGFEKYLKLFKENGITWNDLQNITTPGELKKIGIESSSTRNRILSEIKKIPTNLSSGAPASSPSRMGSKSSIQATPSSSKKDTNTDVQRIHPSPQKELNEYEKAIIQNKKDLKTKIKKYGNEHEEVGDCYYDLGTNYYMNSDYDKAIDCHKKALAIRIKNYGEDDVDVVISYYQLGQDYSFDRSYQKAIKNYKRALELQIELNEDDDHNEGVAAISFDLAKGYYNDGQYDNAITYLDKALEIRRYVHDDEHKSVAEVYHYLGLAYQNKRQQNKALKNFRAALNIYVEIDGMYSDDALLMEDLIGDLTKENNKSEKTENDVAPLESARNNNYTVNIKNKIEEFISDGDEYYKNENYEQASGNYQEALELCESITDADEKTQTIATINFKLGKTSKNLDQFTEAETFLIKATCDFVSLHGKNHFDSARSHSQLGDLYYYMDDYENAITNHKIALASYTSINKEELAAYSHYDLGLDFYWIENYEKSVDHFFQALDIRLKLVGENHESVAKCYNRIGMSYYWDNQLDKSISNHNKALEIRKQLFGTESKEFDESRYHLAQAYYYAEMNDQAREYFSESLKFREKMFGQSSKEYIKTKEWLDKI